MAVADGGGVGFAAIGRIALARGDPAAAIEAVDRVIDAAPTERRYRHGERLEALLVAALAHAALGETEIARARIVAALAAAAPSEYVARFVELGEPIRRLIVQLTPNPDPAVAGMRKRVLDAVAGRQPAKISQAGLVEKLTERELAVLRRLPSSMSAGEIARMMYVSLNTVKTQTQSIYRKLGVNSRHEAVEAARQLGLL
jgi:LuxR family transcriptional regulator, maltose regulon positive regulatory protein